MRYGSHRVIADPMEAGYISVHFWAQAAETAIRDDVRAVREAVRDQTFHAPEGPVRVVPDNQHTWKTCGSVESTPAANSTRSGSAAGESGQYIVVTCPYNGGL
jgi:ABC-type branched-subunit amino acid transport system substrate-binding protein